MINTITKQQKVLLLADGIEFYLDADRADKLAVQIAELKFDDLINFDGRMFSKSMFRGIFNPEDIQEKTKRKNQQWKCNGGKWHQRNEKCTCLTEAEADLVQLKNEAVAACTRGCQSGYIRVKDYPDIMQECDCLANFKNKYERKVMYANI